VVYFGLYQFVGVLGGGTLVNFLENTVFGNWINPLFERIFAAIVPWSIFRSLFVAQFLIMRKERGWGPTLAMSGVILAAAFGVGWLLKTALVFTGVVL
jgi:ferrous iron transport protein B